MAFGVEEVVQGMTDFSSRGSDLSKTGAVMDMVERLGCERDGRVMTSLSLPDRGPSANGESGSGSIASLPP